MKARGGPGAVVPEAEIRTYYDHPVVKPPVWTWEIPSYFFSGGLAGASSAVAAMAAWRGDQHVARVARRAAAGAAGVCPLLLVSDLGRPARFLNMLRVVKVTSPMSMGSWLLTLYAPAAVGAAVLDAVGAPSRWRGVADGVAAVTGPVVATYTAALLADTAVPVWHEARRTLPFSFAGGSMASAGALAAALVGPEDAGAARRTALAGAAIEGGAILAMERRLGHAGAPYHEGGAGRLARAAKGLSAGGAALLALGGRRRRVAIAGAGLLLAGQLCQRWAVFRAGFQSAADPAATIALQRQNLRQ